MFLTVRRLIEGNYIFDYFTTRNMFVRLSASRSFYTWLVVASLRARWTNFKSRLFIHLKYNIDWNIFSFNAGVIYLNAMSCIFRLLLFSCNSMVLYSGWVGKTNFDTDLHSGFIKILSVSRFARLNACFDPMTNLGIFLKITKYV